MADNFYVPESSPLAVSTNTVTSAAHGLVSGDVGKPIGSRATASGKPFVWTDTAATESPVAILVAVVDVNTIQLAYAGEILTIPDTLLPASMPTDGGDTNSRFLYWDTSAGKYVHSCPADSVYLVEAIYWISSDGTQSKVISLLPGRVIPNI